MTIRSKEFSLSSFLYSQFTSDKLHAISLAGYSVLPFCIDKDVSVAVIEDVQLHLEQDLEFTKHSSNHYITPYNLMVELVRKDLQPYNIRGNSFYAVLGRKFKVDGVTLTSLINTLGTTNRVFHEKGLDFNRPYLV